MKKKAFNKFLSVLVSAVLLLFAIPNVTLANQSGELNEESYKLLSALGILKQYPSSETVTRGEFTAICLRFMGTEDGDIELYKELDYFEDIAASPYRAWINAAAAFELVTGYEGANNRKFQPGNEITGEEALSILVRALGYGPEISARKIPASVKATELGLTKHVNLQQKLKAAELVNLLYDALDTRIYDTSAFGEGITLTKGGTALYEYFNVEKIEGIVTQNSVSGLKTTDGAGKNYVAVDNMVYSAGNTDIGYLLGYRVEVLVQEKDSEKTVVYAAPKKNRIVSAAADNIEEETSIDRFVYTAEGGKMKSIDISPSISVVVNGVIFQSYGDEVFKPDNGRVTFIDNNSDGTYNVAVVESYHDYVVTGADAEEITLYDRYGRTPIDNSKAEVTVLKDGKTVDFSKITAGDIVSVYDGGDLIKMVISSHSDIDGTIEEISEENGRTYVGIAGREYMITKDYMALPEVNRVKIELGLTAIFSLNFEGKVASIDRKAASGDKCALIVRAADKGTISKRAEIKVLLTDGNWSILSLAERCKVICGNLELTKNVDADRLKELLGTVPDTPFVKPQPILYKQNSAGEITELNIAPEGTVEPIYTDGDTFVRNDAVTAATYNGVSRIYGRWLCVQNTVIFGVPDYKNGAELDEENFGVYFYNSISGKYDGEVYGASKYNVAGAVVLYDVPGKITYSGQTSLIAVERISESHDANGEEMTVVYGTMGSRHKQYTSKDNAMFSEVHQGDIIQVRMDADRRKVLSVRTVYRDIDVDLDLYNGPVISNPTTQEEIDANQKHMIYRNTYVKRAIWNYPNINNVITGDLTVCTLVHGYLLWKDDAYITVAYPYEAKDTSAVAVDGMVVRSYPISDSVRVGEYIGSGSRKTIKSATVASLVPGSSAGEMDGSEILINTSNGRVDEIWIFDRNN